MVASPAVPEQLLPGWALPDVIVAAERVRVTVPPLLCAEGGYLFGGWAMALAVELGGRWSGRQLRSLACEFLAPIRSGDELDATLDVVRSGSRVAHCAVSVHRGAELALTARLVIGDPLAPLAGRSRAWTPAPPAPDPQDCPGRTYRFRGAGTAIDSLDVRLTAPEPSPADEPGGRVLLWARVRCEVDTSAGLAVLTDHLPYLVVRSIAGVRHATSVSSTMRILAAPVDEWVLLEVELTGTDGLFCVGRVRLWGRDGTPVAVADQTIYLRIG